MSVSIAHDYLTQRGGAERVALTVAEMFPDAPIYTSLYNPERTFAEFRDHRIITSPLQVAPFFRNDARRAFPVLAPTWSRMHAAEDVVIASSSGWSHAITARPGALKVVYCHNPARWIYQPEHYFAGRWSRAAGGRIARQLRTWDRRNALSADVYIANSRAVAARIAQAYGISATVIHPPVSIDPNGEQDPDPQLRRAEYWLTVARGRGYKNVATLIDAVRGSREHRLVVVGPRPPSAEESENVYWTGYVSDARLRWLYANARALVSVSYEDFGLTPLEANSLGTPALLLRAGGFLDSMDEGTSGAWIDEPTGQAVRAAMNTFPTFTPELVCRHADRFSPNEFARQLRHLISARRPTVLSPADGGAHVPDGTGIGM
jgi:glycosyltransferase involved in cell wall biosynthesis